MPDEEDQRGRILKRRVDAGGGVRRPGRPRDETDAGPPGQLAVRLRHVRSACLVPRDDEADRSVPQSVQDRDVALTRNAEGSVDAVDDELVDEDPRAAAAHSSIGSSKKTVAR